MAAGKPQCAALTNRGRRCKNEVAPGRLYCPLHDLDLPTSPRWAAAAEAFRAHPEIFRAKEED